MAGSLPFVQIYSNYDHAVVDFVRGVTYPPDPDLARPVTIVFATPERAFGQLAKRQEELPGRTSTQKTYPLPFVSVERISAAFDRTRESAYAFRRYMQSADGLTYYGMKWPRPMIFLYQVTFWTRQIRDRVDLGTQLYLLFDDPCMIHYITVDHPFPLNSRIVPVTIDEDRVLPMVESPGGQRVLRRAFTLNVAGWITRKADEYGVVEQVLVDIDEGDDDLTPVDDLDDFIVNEDGVVI